MLIFGQNNKPEMNYIRVIDFAFICISIVSEFPLADLSHDNR